MLATNNILFHPKGRNPWHNGGWDEMLYYYLIRTMNIIYVIYSIMPKDTKYIINVEFLVKPNYLFLTYFIQ